MLMMGRALGCGWLSNLPCCSRLLLLHTVACTAAGVAVLVSLLSKNCGGLALTQVQDSSDACSPEQWQVLAAALVAQLSFAGVTVHAMLAENGCQLRAAAAHSVLRGALWILFLAVMGQPMGARVGWGLLAVATSMLDLLLLHLSYHQLGWRQHSWLSCDLRRRHAAEQQQLRQALNTLRTYSCSCGHILVLSLINGLVLALVPDSAAGTSTGAVQLPATGADSPSAQSSPPQLLEARIGVLVSAGLTVLPLLWLVLARCAVLCRSQALEVLATATLLGAGIPPCAGLYFVFSPAYAWPQHLVVRLLLLAAPLAVWLLLLPVTWCAFRAVIALLRQPWAVEAMTKDDAVLAAAADDEEPQEIPGALKPLMQGAWLLKASIQQTTHLASSKSSSKQSLSIMANPSSGRTSSSATNPQGTPTGSSCSSSSGCASLLQAVVKACSSRQHLRFFQLSLDGTTLRWSWNKYVLLYQLDCLTADPAQLRIVLHCVLEPDLVLAFEDAPTWTQWQQGLQLALQLTTGLVLAAPAGEDAAAAAAVTAAGMQSLMHGSSAAVAVVAQEGSRQQLSHQLVRAVLGSSSSNSQQGMPLLPAGSGCVSWCLPPLLGTSSRRSQYDPGAVQLQHAQQMAHSMQAGAAGAPLITAPAGRSLVPPQRCHAQAEAIGPVAAQQPSAAAQEPQAHQQQQQLCQQGGAGDMAPHATCAQPGPAADAAPAGAAADGTQQTVFGAFKIPAGLRSDLMLSVPQGGAMHSSSGGSGSGSGDSAGASRAGGRHLTYLPTFSTGSNGSAGSGRQHSQWHSGVLNAGYCLSPLGLSTAQKHAQQQRALHEATQHMHAQLPPSKQHQLLHWLQQQSSGSCPDSDGPQMSPAYSLADSLLLQHGSAGGGSLQGTNSQLRLPVWSGPGCGQAQQQQLACMQHAGSPLTSPAVLVGASSSSQHILPSRLGLSRSISLPAEHDSCSCCEVQHAQYEQQVAAHPRLMSDAVTGPHIHQPVSTVPQQPAEAGSQGSCEGFSSGDSNNMGSQAACSSETRQHLVLGPTSLRQLGCQLQECPALAAAGEDAAAGAAGACTPRAAAQLTAREPQQPALAAAEQQQEHARWGTESVRGMIAAVGAAVTRRVSFASIAASGPASAAAAAGGGSAGISSSQAVSAARAASAASPEQSSLEHTSSGDLADRCGSSSLKSARRRDASFSSSHQSFGRRSMGSYGIRRDPASFTVRGTWDDCEEVLSGSVVATLEVEEEEEEEAHPVGTTVTGGSAAVAPVAAAGSAAVAAAAAAVTAAASSGEPAADCADQRRQQQQQGWRVRSGREVAGQPLTPVLSVANSDELPSHMPGQPAQVQEQQPTQVQEQQLAQVQQAVAPEDGALDMAAAYQLAIRGTRSEAGTKPAAAPQHSSECSDPECLLATDKQAECDASRTQSWLIATAPAAAAAVSGAEPSPRPAAAAPSAHVHSSASASGADAGSSNGQHSALHARWLVQQEQQDSGGHSSSSSSSCSPARMPHAASAPQLQQPGGSHAATSPTPSMASLHSAFSSHSQASHSSTVASKWWLTPDGCGGSPTSGNQSQQQTPAAPVLTCSDNGTQQSPQQAFKFPAALQHCGEPQLPSAGSQLAPAGPQSPSPMRAAAGPLGLTAAESERISAALALRGPASSPGNASEDARAAARRLSNTASLKKGHMPHVPVELIPWRAIRQGRRLGQGSEGAVLEAVYRDAPVAVKEGASEAEIDMFLSAGTHDNLVGLRGLTQKSDGAFCLVLEHCGKGTLDMLLHHFKSPLPRAPLPLPPRQLAAAAAAAAGCTGDAAGEQHPQQQQQQQPLTRPDVPKLLRLMRGVARGLLHLHTRQPAILHRDIKPANILVGHGMQMKIGDLGMARHVFPPAPASSSSTPGRSPSPLHQDPLAAMRAAAAALSPQHSGLCSGASTPKGSCPAVRTFTPGVIGTIAYSAPEVLGVLDEPQQQPEVETVLKADVYSFGVTLWEGVERRRPWAGLDGMQLWTMWVSDSAVKLPPLSVREAAGPGERLIFGALQQLVSDCTCLTPEARPSMEEALCRISSIQQMYTALMAAGSPPAAAAAGSGGGSGGGGAPSEGGGDAFGSFSVGSEAASVSAGGASRAGSPDGFASLGSGGSGGAVRMWTASRQELSEATAGLLVCVQGGGSG